MLCGVRDETVCCSRNRYTLDMALHGVSGSAPAASAAPSCISGRFDVEALIARGGMALVYRVRDRSTGQALALKWLDTSGSAEHVSRMTALLERERSEPRLRFG